MNIRDNSKRKRALTAALALAGLLLLVLAARQLSRLGANNETVWVASAGLGSGAYVSETDIRMASADSSRLPSGVIRDRSQIEGRQLTRRKQEGSPFTAADFTEESRPTADPGLAGGIPEGRVLMPLKVASGLFHSSRLRRGDRIDVIATTRQGDTELVVRDGFLMGQNRSDSASAVRTEPNRGPFGIDLGPAEPRVAPPLFLYLALHPEDAVGLSRAQASSSSLRIVMHSRDDVRAGRVSDLGAERDRTVELIRGGDRETVPVAY